MRAVMTQIAELEANVALKEEALARVHQQQQLLQPDTVNEQEQLRFRKACLLRALHHSLERTGSATTLVAASFDDQEQLDAKLVGAAQSSTERHVAEASDWKQRHSQLLQSLDGLQRRLLRVLRTHNQTKRKMAMQLAASEQNTLKQARVRARRHQVQAKMTEVEKRKADTLEKVASTQQELDRCWEEAERLHASITMDNQALLEREAGRVEAALQNDCPLAERGDSSESLDMFKKRLESVRQEFKSYKVGVGGEIDELKTLLIDTQVELGHLKGNSEWRADVVSKAQDKLSTLPPWVGIDVASGARSRVKIRNVRLDGPANVAGLLKGDVIEQANGEYTAFNEDFKDMISRVQAGDIATFQINRDGRILNARLHISCKTMKFPDVVKLRRIAGGIVRADDYRLMQRMGLEVTAPPQALVEALVEHPQGDPANASPINAASPRRRKLRSPNKTRLNPEWQS